MLENDPITSQMAQTGAYGKGKIYSKADIAELKAFATKHGMCFQDCLTSL